MRKLFGCLLPVLVLVSFARAAEVQPKKPDEILKATLARLTAIVEPGANAAPQTLTTQLKLTRADGLPKQVRDAAIDLTFQAPDHILLSAHVDNGNYQLARDGQEIWVYTPGKHFGVIGSPDVPRFSADPTSIDRTPLKPFSMPLSGEHLIPLMLMAGLETLPAESINGEPCDVIKITPREPLASTLEIAGSSLELAVRQSDSLPARIRFTDQKHNVELQIVNSRFSDPIAAKNWKLKATAQDNIARTAVSHLCRFAKVAIPTLFQKVPTLGPAVGDIKVDRKSVV